MPGTARAQREHSEPASETAARIAGPGGVTGRLWVAWVRLLDVPWRAADGWVRGWLDVFEALAPPRPGCIAAGEDDAMTWTLEVLPMPATAEGAAA